MTQIFISYRRADNPDFAARLYDRLKARFGQVHVFMDFEAIAPGAKFPTAIQQALDTCHVLLVVIGPEWLKMTDENGQRRLDKKDDYVRREVKTGLDRGIAVIPVLMKNVQLPATHQLPTGLKELADCQAITLLFEEFDHGATRLVQQLEIILKTAGVSLLPSENHKPSMFRLLRADNKDLLLETHERLISIGRAPKNLLPITDPDVSWEHGQIILRQGDYHYHHLSSNSPTILRRRGLEQLFRPGQQEELPLRNQDRLTIGGMTLIVEFDLTAEDSGYVTTARKPEENSPYEP